MEIYAQAKPFADPSKGREDESTLAILVPAAEPLVRDYRARYDTSAREGMPAHVTIIWPFMHPNGLIAETIYWIENILARSEPFAFSLADIGQFNSQVLYLRPEPDGPIKALIQAVREAFPDYPPYGGFYDDSVTPHLTVAKVNSPDEFKRAEADFHALSDGFSPIAAGNAEISLMERRGGLWWQKQIFALGQAAALSSIPPNQQV